MALTKADKVCESLCIGTDDPWLEPMRRQFRLEETPERTAQGVWHLICASGYRIPPPRESHPQILRGFNVRQHKPY